jgi:DNA repair exonuclease SbcCD ATPase subunit
MMKEKEKELKKLIHQAEKTKAAYIDAPGALRVVLAEDYERINSQISIVKDEIAELQNTVRDEAAVEKQIQNVQNAIQQYKNTELESLDRKTVDTFIHKIVICLNGIVEVHMSSDSIQRYSLLNIVPKKMDPQMGSSFYSKQEVSYNYDKLGYLEQVREFLKLIIEEHKQSFNITLFSYDIEEKRCGAQNRNEKRKFNVAVEINFNNNEGSAVCR